MQSSLWNCKQELINSKPGKGQNGNFQSMLSNLELLPAHKNWWDANFKTPCEAKKKKL